MPLIRLSPSFANKLVPYTHSYVAKAQGIMFEKRLRCSLAIDVIVTFSLVCVCAKRKILNYEQ